MRKLSKRPGLLVCVELGASWPEGLAAAAAGVVRRVVAQVDGETPEAFASRAAALSGRLFSDGVDVREAVVASNERTDPSASRARRTLGSRLLERLGRAGKLSFSADARASGRARHALSALALELGSATSASVTVHFGVDAEVPSERAVARVA